jgi:hypothetical protein
MVLMYQATTSIIGRIKKSMTNRREKEIQYKDIIGRAMEDASDEQLADPDKCIAIRGALFGACTGVISSLTMVVKYLHDYPEVKESIKARNSCSCFEKVILGKYSSTISTY